MCQKFSLKMVENLRNLKTHENLVLYGTLISSSLEAAYHVNFASSLDISFISSVSQDALSRCLFRWK